MFKKYLTNRLLDYIMYTLYTKEGVYMKVILIIVAVVVVISVAVSVIKSMARKSRSKCSKCGAKYVYGKDITASIGNLQWERKTKKEQKGDYVYEIEYKVFYRMVSFTCICPSCKKAKVFSKRFDLYRNDSNYSQSHAQEMSLLNEKIRDYFDKSVFEE